MLVERVEFVGQHEAGPASLRHLAEIRNGTTIWGVDTRRARDGVMRHPWVRDARVRRVFPDTVRVEIEERVPSALLRAERMYLVDDRGVVFMASDGKHLDLPVISGIDRSLFERHPDIPRLALRDALQIVAQLDERGVLPRDDVSEVVFSESRGFTVHTLAGSRIRFGLDGFERQVDRLQRLVHRDVDLDAEVLVDLAPSRLAIVRPVEGTSEGS